MSAILKRPFGISGSPPLKDWSHPPETSHRNDLKSPKDGRATELLPARQVPPFVRSEEKQSILQVKAREKKTNKSPIKKTGNIFFWVCCVDLKTQFGSCVLEDDFFHGENCCFFAFELIFGDLSHLYCLLCGRKLLYLPILPNFGSWIA